MDSYLGLKMPFAYYAADLIKLQNAYLCAAGASLQSVFNNLYHPFYSSYGFKFMRAGLALSERFTKEYIKRPFGIEIISIGEHEYKVEQSTVLSKPFCNLLHFKKVGFHTYQPKLLLVAPLAGHYATLLRRTVQEILPYFDVYVTDWISASQVPLSQGKFDMDDYIDYVIEFFTILGPHFHVMAVCQPTVPVLAATALMSADNDTNLPRSMVLIGGPIDARQNPTPVNVFATEHNLDWFNQNVITVVPHYYPGFLRKVYPGSLQLLGFISMHLNDHTQAHVDLFYNILACDEAKVAKHIEFYDEFLTVLDLPAEFYLQTIKEVFLEFALATGKLVSRGRNIDLAAITRPALLGIEGEKDDIAAVGQTKASLNLCVNIAPNNKHYHIEPGVGHYGAFAGRKFHQGILPIIKDFVCHYD